MICRGCEWWGPRVARHSSHRSQAEQCLGSRLRLAHQPAPHTAASRSPPIPAAGSATARPSYCQKKRARSPCAPRLQFPDYSETGSIAACRNPRKLPQIPSRQCENQQHEKQGSGTGPAHREAGGGDRSGDSRPAHGRKIPRFAGGTRRAAAGCGESGQGRGGGADHRKTRSARDEEENPVVGATAPRPYGPNPTSGARFLELSPGLRSEILHDPAAAGNQHQDSARPITLPSHPDWKLSRPCYKGWTVLPERLEAP